MANELEKRIERILFSNQSGDIAEELFDLLLDVGRPEAVEAALSLLYPKIDHCESSRAQYITERGQVLGENRTA